MTPQSIEKLRELLKNCEESGSSLPLDEMVVAVGYIEFTALLDDLERKTEALEWFVAETERANKKGYDLTELILERCLANAKKALSGEGSTKL